MNFSAGAKSLIRVIATALDIRPLLFGTDSVNVSGSDVTVSNTVEVEATDLDIRPLDAAADSIEVLATDLDIRDLLFATDKVDVSGSNINIVSPVDAITEALEVIDYEHHEIHSGSHYYICNFEVLDDAASIDLAITTPNTTKWTHMTFDISGTSQTEFRIYETATVTGGTAGTPLNNNRNSANISVVTVVKNPTVTVLGNLIFAQSSGLAAATPNKAENSGVVSRNREIILKQNTTYIFRITSRQDDNIISYCGEWYEHTNK